MVTTSVGLSHFWATSEPPGGSVRADTAYYYCRFTAILWGHITHAQVAQHVRNQSCEGCHLPCWSHVSIPCVPRRPYHQPAVSEPFLSGSSSRFWEVRRLWTEIHRKGSEMARETGRARHAYAHEIRDSKNVGSDLNLHW